MIPKHFKRAKFAATAAAIAFGTLAGGANGSIIFSGDFGDLDSPTEPGFIEITRDITFTLTSSFRTDILRVVLDEAVIDPVTNNFLFGPDYTFLLNGAEVTTFAFFVDSGSDIRDLTEKDASILFFFDPIAFMEGDTITVLAGDPLGFAPTDDPNPQFNDFVFTGDVFIVSGGDVNPDGTFGETLPDGLSVGDAVRRSANVSLASVPEPSSALLVALGALGAVARRRRVR